MALSLASYKSLSPMTFHCRNLKHYSRVTATRDRVFSYEDFLLNLKLHKDKLLKDDVLRNLMGRILNKPYVLIDNIESKVFELKLFNPLDGKIDVKYLIHKLKYFVKDEEEKIKQCLIEDFKYEKSQLTSENSGVKVTKNMLEGLVKMMSEKTLAQLAGNDLLSYKKLACLDALREQLYISGKAKENDTLKHFAEIIVKAKEEGFSNEDEALLYLKTVTLENYTKDVENSMHQFLSRWVNEKREKYNGFRALVISKDNIHLEKTKILQKYFYALDRSLKLLSGNDIISTEKLIETNTKSLKYCKTIEELYRNI